METERATDWLRFYFSEELAQEGGRDSIVLNYLPRPVHDFQCDVT